MQRGEMNVYPARKVLLDDTAYDIATQIPQVLSQHMNARPGGVCDLLLCENLGWLIPASVLVAPDLCLQLGLSMMCLVPMDATEQGLAKHETLLF